MMITLLTKLYYYMIYNSLKRLICRPLIVRPSQAYGELVYTHQLATQVQTPKVPAYRAIDLQGRLVDKKVKYDAEELAKILKTMIFVEEMDSMLLKIKGQGKISFYMSSEGELGSVIGSAAALKPQDLVYTQYREQGAHIWRGFTLDNVFNQCIGTVYDAAKGRQMPVHYGSKDLNNVTVSSPLTTQVPQAAGSGYAFRVAKENKVAACYLGQGAASEGDFPTALNFAATLKCQTLFLLRNNKYAISTRFEDQYATDGIISKAIAYGIASSRVDGNDALAVLEATRFARNYIIQNGKPYFLELMTYRVGDHSTSDNSTLYRSDQERKEYREINNPIKRLTKFLDSMGHKRTVSEQEERKSVRQAVTESLHRCEKHKLPSMLSLFDDVYDRLPAHLVEQKEELRQHLAEYGHKYDFLNKHEA